MDFTTITGEKLNFSDWHGHPVLVSFWASDCRSCILDLPLIDRLYRQFAGRGLRVVAIAMQYDPPDRVLQLARSADIPYSVVLDSLGLLAKSFGDVKLVPTTLLVGADGFIRYRATGAIDFERFREQILSIFKDA